MFIYDVHINTRIQMRTHTRTRVCEIWQRLFIFSFFLRSLENPPPAAMPRAAPSVVLSSLESLEKGAPRRGRTRGAGRTSEPAEGSPPERRGRESGKRSL